MSESVTIRFGRRSIRIPISDDIGEMICFYNTRTKRSYCFQFGYVDRRFTIIRYLRRFCICVTATALSEAFRHWSKNLYLESMSCYDVEEYQFKKFTDVNEFADFIRDAELRVLRVAEACFSQFGWGLGKGMDVRGYELRIRSCFSYCCGQRFDYDVVDDKPTRTVMRERCWSFESLEYYSMTVEDVEKVRKMVRFGRWLQHE